MSSPIFRDGSTWLLGQVAEFHPATHTYTVTANSRIFRGVARLLDHPGDVIGLAPKTLVAMHRELGEWVIAGIINQQAAGQPELAPVQVTEVQDIGAGDPAATEPQLGDARAPNAPTDVSTEDWVRHGEVGQLLGLLKGGLVIAKASPLAQVRLHQQKDLVEIVSHLFRHITAMGESSVSSDNGRLMYTWRGAADASDVGPDGENYTIRLDVGATETGDIFSFAVTTPEGRVLSRISMTPAGRLELRGVGVDVTAGSAGGPSSETYAGDRSTHVEGSLTENVEQDLACSVGGEHTSTVQTNSSETVGGNRSTLVNGNATELVSGNARRKILAGALPGLPGSAAEIVEYVNGSVEVTLGRSAVPSAFQSANWVNYVGGFNFALQTGALPPPIGAFNVLSATPMSVNLGCDGAAVLNPLTGAHDITALPAPYGVMKYEPFVALINAMVSWMRTHTHPSAMGPTGVPLIDPGPSVTPLITPIRSVRVGVGL